MSLKEGVHKKFVTNTDETGRFIVRSPRTGRTYYVEPIGITKTHWGDLNPATKKVEGNYGAKYQGSISEKESLITEENGFVNIRTLTPGTSPIKVIEAIDDLLPDAK